MSGGRRHGVTELCRLSFWTSWVRHRSRHRGFGARSERIRTRWGGNPDRIWELEDMRGSHTCFIVQSATNWALIHRMVIPHQLTNIQKFYHFMSSRFFEKNHVETSSFTSNTFSDVKVKNNLSYEFWKWPILCSGEQQRPLPNFLINSIRLFR